MAKYEVRFKQSVRGDLKGIPGTDVRRILDRIESLSDDPRSCGCIKLAGSDLYRERVGVYRIVYQIFDDVMLVIVITVCHRRDV